MISILIADDDSNKLIEISKVIKETNISCNIVTCQTYKEIQQHLNTTQFHVMIFDVQMPILKDQIIDTQAGLKLIRELQRKSFSNIPSFCLGLTSFIERPFIIERCYTILNYTLEDWKSYLRSLLNHATAVSHNPRLPNLVSKPQILVEGFTDYLFFNRLIQVFEPESLETIEIKFQREGGAQWVAKQTLANIYSAPKDLEGNKILTAAIFDNDAAASYAINEVLKANILKNSAEEGYFKVFKYEVRLSPYLVSLAQNGIVIEACLEHLFPPKYWREAIKKGYVLERKLTRENLTKKNSFDEFNTSLKDHLLTLPLTEENKLYLFEVDDDCKSKFTKFVTEEPDEEFRNHFSFLHPFLLSILEYLKT